MRAEGLEQRSQPITPGRSRYDDHTGPERGITHAGLPEATAGLEEESDLRLVAAAIRMGAVQGPAEGRFDLRGTRARRKREERTGPGRCHLPGRCGCLHLW